MISNQDSFPTIIGKLLNFYGVLIHSTAEKKIIEFDTYESVFLFIQYYLCPLKNCNSNHLTVLPFYLRLPDKKFKKHQNDLLSSINKFRFMTSGHLRKYIDNTEAYFKEINIIINK